MTRHFAEDIIPADHRLLGPDDLAALRRVLLLIGIGPEAALPTSAVHRLAALLEDG